MKVKVVKNIGEESKYEFGVEGNILEVKDGCIKSLRPLCYWEQWSQHECTIEALNKYFGEEDQYQTVFELVEE